MLLTNKYLSMKKIKILGIVRTILNVLLFIFISLYVLTLFITPVYYVDGKRTVSSQAQMAVRYIHCGGHHSGNAARGVHLQLAHRLLSGRIP